MSDSYCSIVPFQTYSYAAETAAKKLVQILAERKVIHPTLSSCILNGEGYPPAENYAEITERRDDAFLKQSINGLEVKTGRQVFPASGLDKVLCPKCAHNIIRDNWPDLIKEWTHKTGPAKFRRPQCHTSHVIADYVFEPEWAFGELGLTFWNWPPLKDSFLKEIEVISGSRLKVIKVEL
jgi:hypothetical protein